MSQVGSLYDAGFAAQKLAFAPVSFMVCICMQRFKVWDVLLKNLGSGSTPDEVASSCDISPYAAKLLLESSAAIEAVRLDGATYHITKLGHILAKDAMTRVNFDFIYDVCFKGLFHLEASLRSGTPVGLQELGPWPTIYEGLKDLPTAAKTSWFAFDHFYSDSAFRDALPYVFDRPVSTLLDIGGNTGRFTREALKSDPLVHITIADLQSQITLAKAELEAGGVLDRIHLYAVDLLKPEAELPRGFDVVWMSQFLVCFSVEQISEILKKAAQAIKRDGRVIILDTFWDLQRDPASAYGVIQTSPYFAALANGTSKMYDSQTVLKIASNAGLQLTRITKNLGLAHTLVELQINQPSDLNSV